MDLDIESGVVEVEVMTSNENENHPTGQKEVDSHEGNSLPVGIPKTDNIKTKKKRSKSSVSSKGSTVAKAKSVVSVDPSQTSSQYYVERIVDKRHKCGRTEYLIKWEGYPS